MATEMQDQELRSEFESIVDWVESNCHKSLLYVYNYQVHGTGRSDRYERALKEVNNSVHYAIACFKVIRLRRICKLYEVNLFGDTRKANMIDRICSRMVTILLDRFSKYEDSEKAKEETIHFITRIHEHYIAHKHVGEHPEQYTETIVTRQMALTMLRIATSVLTDYED